MSTSMRQTRDAVPGADLESRDESSFGRLSSAVGDGLTNLCLFRFIIIVHWIMSIPRLSRLRWSKGVLASHAGESPTFRRPSHKMTTVSVSADSGRW